MKNRNRWQFLFREGHKFFYDLSTGPDTFRGIRPVFKELPHRVAIADDSGDYPDLTCDGVLYLDRWRPIVRGSHCGRPMCSIPVIAPDGRELATFAYPKEVTAVITRFGMDAYDQPSPRGFRHEGPPTTRISV